jgi:hypothetical protein
MAKKKVKAKKKKRASKYEKKFVIHGTMEDVLKASILHAEKNK